VARVRAEGALRVSNVRAGRRQAREPVVRHPAQVGVLGLLARVEGVEIRLEDPANGERGLELVVVVVAPWRGRGPACTSRTEGRSREGERQEEAHGRERSLRQRRSARRRRRRNPAQATKATASGAAPSPATPTASQPQRARAFGASGFGGSGCSGPSIADVLAPSQLQGPPLEYEQASIKEPAARRAAIETLSLSITTST